MTGIVVQARLGSTRLKRKALLPLGSDCLLGWALTRLARVDADVRVLAVDQASRAELESLAVSHGFSIMAGPAEDVLSRYCLAVRNFALDHVIRATGDNPFVSPELANLLLAEEARMGQAAHSQYRAHTGMPLGMGVELIDARSLLEADAEAQDLFEREHVCPFLYRRPERFRVMRNPAPKEFILESGRVTVDTPEDYRAVLDIVQALGDDPSSMDIVAWLKAGTLP